jgi:nicotinamidase-related amidase
MSKPITLDPKTTAFVMIDLQHGIMSRTTAPHTTDEVVARCAKLAETLREKGGMPVYVHVDLANFVKVNADAPTRDPNAPPPPAIASELVPAAGKKDSDLLITKSHWSAFINTELDAKLRARGIRTVLIGGVATNYGVESTVRDGVGLGYDFVMLEDAMSSLSNELHRFSIENIFPALGRVRVVSQITFS